MYTVTTDNRELMLGALLMARPDLLHTAFPPNNDDLKAISNPVARSAIVVLQTYGPAYANPQAMAAALEDMPSELDGNHVIQMLASIPEPADVELSNILDIKADIVAAARRRSLGETFQRTATLLAAGNDESVEAAERAIREWRVGTTGSDATATGILADLEAGSGATTRWRCGSLFLDGLAKGVDAQGNLADGMLGQGEIVVLSAQYGAGKTRLALNWVNELLNQQGASIDILATEDRRGTYLVKLMGLRFGLEKWRIEQYLAARPAYLNTYGQETALKIAEALDWGSSVGNRLRIYDGQKAKVNIFRFARMKGLLEESAAVHGTTHTVVDYVQAWPGDELTVSGYAQELREYGSRNNVGLVLLSQVANSTMDYGVAPGVVPAKGSGAWGAIAHFGLYLEKDPLIGQKEIKISLIKGRDTGGSLVYAHFNETTGKVLDYAGAPTWLDIPAPDNTGQQTKKGRAKSAR